VTEECEIEETISPEKISSALQALVGTHTLAVSAYSAVKKDGVPLYKKARALESQGKTLDELPQRDMTVYSATLLSYGPELVEGKKRYSVEVRFSVASGVYIRSLAVYFGELLGYPATLKSLRRTKVGEYCVEDARLLDDF
jgi:tRNA pseudouridine55 synthase